MTDFRIRKARTEDGDALWALLEPVLRTGETYALPTDWSREEALAFWNQPGHHVFVADLGSDVVGTYYLKANQKGPGDHVCNCGYITGRAAEGRGVAKALCLHSQDQARTLGFQAMQFNSVVATNTRAVALWERLGYATVGRLPGAFRHPREGLVDALVMYKQL